MKPPFIATQRLWQLVCPPEFQAKCLEPEKLWTLPRDDDAGVRNIDVHGLPSGTCCWERIPNRRDFLADLSNTRLCLTILAGVGKTIALRQTEYLRQAGDNRDALAVRVDFAELPADPGETLPWLVRKLQNTKRTRKVAVGQLTALIERKIRQGRFTLLVDALDQSAAVKDPFAACRSLRDFLQRYPEVRCVVSGRPWAVHRYWRQLFESQGTWKFAKIDVFTREECQRFVGPKRFGLLSRLGADVISIPRSLEMILQIPDDALSGLRTKCDVYWRSLEHMQKWALQDQDRELGLSEPQAWSIFSLVAFEMLRRGFHAGSGGIASGREAEEFILDLWKSRHEMLPGLLAVEELPRFHNKLSNLMAVCENVADAVVEQSTTPKVIQFFWRNQTLMEMFAALWVTRYADEKDRSWFAEQPGNEEPAELCRLVAEMPADAYRYDRSAYAQSLSFLYTGQSRWTELVYRSWPNMLQMAGYLTTNNWTEEDLQRATRRAQQEAWQRVADEQPLSDTQNPARNAMLKFLGEFPLIVHGEQGPKKQRTAKRFQARFVPIPPDDSCSHTFRKHWVEGQPEIEIAPFRMAATQVTNAQYELFDPAHGRWLSDYRQYSPMSTCPAIYITWYDAWCFAAWAGCRLPTEEEWEYGCRAGTDTEYSFGDDENMLGDYAWYAANSGGKSHPVAKKKPNPWGLYDVHGNVGEWCADWYSADYAASPVDHATGLAGGSIRVIRGGSWYDEASFCRAAFRCRFVPSYRDNFLGFRLARAVSSPSR